MNLALAVAQGPSKVFSDRIVEACERRVRGPGSDGRRRCRQLGTEIQRAAIVEQQGALDDMGQLPNIAGPRVARQGPHRGRSQRRHRPGTALPKKVLHEFRQVPRPLPERRHLQGKHREAKVEILAKAAFGDLGFEVLVGGRDDANIDGDRPSSSNPFDLPVLERPQQPNLRRRRQLADLVEKKGAAMGPFEASPVKMARPGEGSFFVTEELAVEHSGSDGAAV